MIRNYLFMLLEKWSQLYSGGILSTWDYVIIWPWLIFIKVRVEKVGPNIFFDKSMKLTISIDMICFVEVMLQRSF